MANLHFKNSSDVFLPLVEQSKGLKIGLSAYKAYIDKKLLEFSELTQAMYDDDDDYVEKSEHNWDDNVVITKMVDGINYIGYATLRDIVDLTRGTVQSITWYKTKPELKTTTLVSGINEFTLDDLNSFVTEKISCLQGQSVIFGAAIKQNLNDSFNPSTLLSEVQLRGFDTSDYLQNLMSSLSAGFSWSDVLSFIAGNTTTPTTDNEGFWCFDVDQYTNTNAIVLGLSSIVTTVGTFFSNLQFDINKIGKFFEGLWNGITDLVGWLIQLVAGDLFCDYVIKNDYGAECFNIPVASLTVDINDIIDAPALSLLVREVTQTHPLKSNKFAGYIYAADNEYDGNYYYVHYSPDLVSLVNHISTDIPDQTNLLIPWSRGFMYISRQDDTLRVYYFLGDQRSSDYMTRWSIDSDGEISVKSHGIWHKSYSAKEWKTNADFANWFKGLFNPGAGSSDYTDMRIVADNNFVGVGPEQDGMSTGYENYLPMSYDLSNIDTPKSVITACQPYYYNGIPDVNAAALLLNALMYANIHSRDTVRGSIILSTQGDRSIAHIEQDFSQINFLPYEKNTMPSFKYHAQSDDERTKEVLELFKKIAIAAVAVGVAAATVKVRKSIKMKGYAAQAKADAKWRTLGSLNAEQSSYLLPEAYAAQRKANIWKGIGNLIGGKTVNSAISDALGSLSTPDAADDQTALLYRSITGKKL